MALPTMAGAAPLLLGERVLPLLRLQAAALPAAARLQPRRHLQPRPRAHLGRKQPPPRACGRFARQYAPAAPDQAHGGHPPRQLADVFWLVGHTYLVCHSGAHRARLAAARPPALRELERRAHRRQGQAPGLRAASAAIGLGLRGACGAAAALCGRRAPPREDAGWGGSVSRTVPDPG